MKLITKIKKAEFGKKSELWQDADLSRAEAEELVREMILSLPGYYSLHRRGLGENLVDKVFEIYGWMPAMFVSEEMLLGMQALNEKRVYASFSRNPFVNQVIRYDWEKYYTEFDSYGRNPFVNQVIRYVILNGEIGLVIPVVIPS